MKYEVHMWHGYTDDLFDDLIKLCGCEAGRNFNRHGDRLTYEGSLDDFIANWKRPMMVLPHDNVICVTQHRNFNQR